MTTGPDPVRRGQALAGLAVALTGGLCLSQATTLPASPIGGPVGSAALPFAIGLGLVLLGLSLMAEAWRGGWHCEAREAGPGAGNRAALGWVLGAWGAAFALLWLSGSFILAAAALFTLAVRAFHDGRWGVSLLIGLVTAALAYGLFAGLLGLSIGEGAPERMFRWLLRF